MARSSVPVMRLHKPSGNAYARIGGRQVYFGRWGTREARERYDRAVAEWLAAGRPRAGAAPDAGAGAPAVTVAVLCAEFLAHAETYYVGAGGLPTGEAANFRDALRPAVRLYRELPAAEFDQDNLAAVRADMVASGLSRATINARVARIRRVWRWGASRKLVPAAALAELSTLQPLLRNRTEAPEAPGVAPVDPAVVTATLPFMPAPVAAMVRIQALTGCRVGEVLRMSGAAIERDGEVWTYRPSAHKGSHRGRGRAIPLGPRARAALAPWIERHGDGWLFRPEDADGVTRKVRDRYDRRSYAQAIRRACDRAFPHPRAGTVGASALEDWRKAHRWSPLQLRHMVGTAVRGEYGVEAAQAVLGHAKADVTQLYAERLDGAARAWAEQWG